MHTLSSPNIDEFKMRNSINVEEQVKVAKIIWHGLLQIAIYIMKHAGNKWSDVK